MEKRLVKYGMVPVEFTVKNGHIMVNATQMAKIFNKKVEAFIRNDNTEDFICACLKSENSRFLAIKSETELIVSKQKSGTWMHRILALKFAAWLDSDFEVWVYTTIEDILFGRYRELEDSLRQSAMRKNKIDVLKNELRHDEKFRELERLELEERQAAHRRGRVNRNQLELFKEELH